MRKGHVIMHLQFENRFWEVKLDIEDYMRFRGMKFGIHKPYEGSRYLRVTVGSEHLCRAVMNYKGKLYIDHANRVSLDNRKRNLRLATKSQNQQNRAASSNNTYSKYKGISYDKNAKQSQKWCAEIQANRVRYKKRFHTEAEAALWYNAAAKYLHGEFAVLNDVEGSAEKFDRKTKGFRKNGA